MASLILSSNSIKALYYTIAWAASFFVASITASMVVAFSSVIMAQSSTRSNRTWRSCSYPS